MDSRRSVRSRSRVIGSICGSSSIEIVVVDARRVDDEHAPSPAVSKALSSIVLRRVIRFTDSHNLIIYAKVSK